MCRPWNVSALLVTIALVTTPPPTPAQQATRLVSNTPIWRDMTAGDVHYYAITLDSGQFAFIPVEQRGIDVIVRVHGPDGGQLTEVDSPNGSRGLEPVRLYTTRAGEYRLTVVPFRDDAEPGRYSIAVDRVEPAASTLAGRVDQLFAPWDRPGSPGASVGIMEDGAIVHVNGYGEAQLEYGIPITAETVFHVASVSKQFTAFAVMLLASRGMLSLDDDIRDYLPELHDFGPTITIRHLIHHTSGLRDQWDLLSLAGWRLDDVITRDQILRLLERQRELNFPPGEQYLYCNSGYTLLAEIVSRVTGTPFPAFMREEVFEPLEMDHTHFHDDHEHLVANRAYSYAQEAEGGYRNRVLSYATVGATSLFTTAADALRWMANLDRGSVGGSGVLALMHERGVLTGGDTISYAGGLAIGQYRGLALVGHTGGDAGFRSYIGRFPERGLAIAVFSNHAAFDAGGMARRIADLYLEGRFPEDPAALPPAEESATPVRADVDAAVFDTLAGWYSAPPAPVIEVERRRDRLMARQPAEPWAELIPQPDGTFVVDGIPGVFRFRREGSAVTALEHVREDTVVTALRLPDFDPRAVALEGYTGRYYSAELETAYTLVVEDGRLTAVHVRHDPLPLVPIGPDRFDVEGAELRFERDAHGAVTGMRISAGRAQHVWFGRMGS